MTLEEIQDEETRLLVQFAELCDRNDLRYYLAYGSALGAVREHGPIPWDDDADVAMPRPDYEKLLALAPCVNNCKILETQREDYPWMFGKFVSLRTVFDEPGLVDPAEYGVYIDIFPLDGLPGRHAKMTFSLVRQGMKLYLYSYHMDASHAKHRSWKGCVKRIAGFFGRLVSREVLWRTLNGAATKHDFETSEYVGCYFSPYSYEKENMSRDCFEGFSTCTYDTAILKTFKDPESYLERIYGPRWQIPVKQDNHIHGKAFWKDGGDDDCC